MTRQVKYKIIELVRRECLHAVHVALIRPINAFSDINYILSEKAIPHSPVEWLINHIYMSATHHIIMHAPE